MEDANVKQFLSMSSQTQFIFQYDSKSNNYIVMKGNQKGYTIKELLDIDYEQTKEMLECLYYDENSNQHTKNCIKDIIKLNKIKNRR